MSLSSQHGTHTGGEEIPTATAENSRGAQQTLEMIQQFQNLQITLEKAMANTATQMQETITKESDDSFEKLEKLTTRLQMLEKQHAINKERLEKKISAHQNISVKSISNTNTTTHGEQSKVSSDTLGTSAVEDIKLPNMDVTSKNITSDYIMAESFTDARGEYLKIVTKSGKVVQHYWTKPEYQLRNKLRTLLDFPRWCQELSQFCCARGLDDITEESTLTPSEEYALRELICHSVEDDFAAYQVSNHTASEIYSEILTYVQRRYPREVKDKMWKKIVIDATCANEPKIGEILSNIIFLEKFTEKRPAYRLDDNDINEKLIATLTTDLQVSIGPMILEHKDASGLAPTTLIKLIKEVVWKTQKRLYNGPLDIRECPKCHSTLHSPKNCRKHGSDNSKPEWKDNIDHLRHG